MNGYTPKHLSLALGTTAVYGASLTDHVISAIGVVTAGGSRAMRIEITSSAVTVGGGISVKLQTLAGATWSTLATANATKAVTAAGTVVMSVLDTRAADQADLPLGGQVRIVLTTGAGSSITISSVTLLQDL